VDAQLPTTQKLNAILHLNSRSRAIANYSSCLLVMPFHPAQHLEATGSSACAGDSGAPAAIAPPPTSRSLSRECAFPRDRESNKGAHAGLAAHAPDVLRFEDPNAERLYCDHVFSLLCARPELISKKNNYAELHALLQNINVHPPYGNAKVAKVKGFKCGWEILSADSRFVVEREFQRDDDTHSAAASNCYHIRVSLACQEAAAASPATAAASAHSAPSSDGSRDGCNPSDASELHTSKKARADVADACAPVSAASYKIVQKLQPALVLPYPAQVLSASMSVSAFAAVGAGIVRSTDGGKVATTAHAAAPKHALAPLADYSSPASSVRTPSAQQDTKIIACLDLSRYLVTWMIMYPSVSDLHRYCIRAYVKLWADWMDAPAGAAAASDGPDAVPEPPFVQARNILSQFMLRERLKMKLSDSPWKVFSNASLVIQNFLFIGAGNCSQSPIMLTQPPPCPDDSEPTDFSFNQRKALLKQFYDHNNIRFIVNVSGRDDFMRSAEYPISANRTYSAAETSDLFTNLAELPMDAVKTHLNGDHVTVFLMHMEDVEHWPQDQVHAAAFRLQQTLTSGGRAWRWTAPQ
jgi:hypothetical protein